MAVFCQPVNDRDIIYKQVYDFTINNGGQYCHVNMLGDSDYCTVAEERKIIL